MFNNKSKMEKDFRLFVKNLPININEAKVQNLLEQHVTVKKIDLKEKKDLNNKLHKFAFVNVSATDKQMNNCFGALNGEKIDGFEISIEVAKENFLDRLKREREETQLKKESSILMPIEKYVKSNLSDSFNTVANNKHKIFSDNDFSPEIKFENEKSMKTSIEGGDLPTQVSPDQNDKQKYSEKSEILFKSDSSNEMKLDKMRTPKKKIKFKSYNDLERCKINEYDDIKTNNNDIKKNNTLNKSKKNSQQVTQTPEISESEKKRQLSLKQKKNTFKTREQLIHNALKSVGNNKFNNKILFNDDIEKDNLKCKKPKIDNEKKALFNSDDENENEEIVEWDKDELEAKSQINQKLMKLQARIGYDERFVLDERFIEDENEKENKEENEITANIEDSENVMDEKKWQLNILKDILSDTVKTAKPDTKDNAKKQNKMIRYDPTASNHQEFEVTAEKPKNKIQTKKKVKQIERVEEPVPKISNEIFFEVGNLTIGNQGGGFTLIKTNNVDSEVNTETHENESSSGFKFHFNADVTENHGTKSSKNIKESIFETKNAFMCNSSNDEENNGATESSFQFGLNLQEDNIVFFVTNDSRFAEAVEFFKKETIQEENFKIKRRGLKQIVRSKIRNNMKKNIPWNKKKICKFQRRN